MAADIANRAYNPNRDPPFLIPADDTDEISPTIQPPHRPYIGCIEAATDDQKEILLNARHALHPYELYIFHRHIHDHRLKRRSFVHICRDEADLNPCLAWMNESYNGRLGKKDITPPTASQRALEWPYGDPTFRRQLQDWRDKTGDRERHLEEVRASWKRLVKQRARERMKLLSLQRREKQRKEQKEAEVEHRLQQSLRRLRRKKMGPHDNERPKIRLCLRLGPPEYVES